MKKSLWIGLLLTCFSAAAFGHPMGNFSINHYSRFEFTGSELRLHYVIDFAEIPTFQEMQNLDTNHDGKVSEYESTAYARAMSGKLQQNLQVTINRQIQQLQIHARRVQILPGAGGLPVLQLILDLAAPYQSMTLNHTNMLEYSDHNFPERIGWKEILLSRQLSAPILNSTAASQDRSHELTQYPQDPLTTAPQELHAEISFGLPVATAIAAEKPSEGLVRTLPFGRDDRFTALISGEQLSLQLVLFSFLIAFGLGAMHALSPGHGKTIVAGYLVGSRGTARHALLLGATVTLTHTIGVFALGLLTLYFSRFILPERLYPWIGFLSGVSIVAIGIHLFFTRLRSTSQHHHDHAHHDHPHPEDHAHTHHHHHHHEDSHADHGHSHVPIDAHTGEITWKSLMTVGISGGALPCPSALVVLLSAISLHRIGFGLLLIVSFSLGLAVVLTGIGILMVYAAAWSHRLRFGGAILSRMPLISSLVIAAFGLAIALQAFR